MNRSSARLLSVLACVFLWGITLLSGFLLTESEMRKESFFIALGFLLLAEAMVSFGADLVGGNENGRMMPWVAGMMFIPLTYLAAAGLLAIVAVVGLPWRWLLLAELFALGCTVLTLAYSRVARRSTMTEGDREHLRREQWLQVKRQFDPVHEYFQRLLENPAISNNAAALYDELRYSSPSSSGGSEQIEGEISAALRAIVAILQSQEKLDADAISRKIDIARQLIRRREQLVTPGS